MENGDKIRLVEINESENSEATVNTMMESEQL